MRAVLMAVSLLLVPLAGAQQSVLEVSDAYVRGMPPGRTVTAAFFEIANHGDSDCRLVAVNTDIARSAELHTHLHENGVMKMRKVPGVDIAAGERLLFQPGGLHVMLFGVQPLKDGEPVEMTLAFADCEPLAVQAEVRSARR